MRSKVSSVKGQADSDWAQTGFKFSAYFEPRNRTFTDDDTTPACSTNDFPNHCHSEDKGIRCGSSQLLLFVWATRLQYAAKEQLVREKEELQNFRTSEFG